MNEYAMKEIAKFQIQRLGKHQLNAIYWERDLLEQTKESNFIINLEATFQDNENLYYLMELCSGGSMRKIIDDKNDNLSFSIPLKDNQIRFIVAELL